MKFNWFIQNSRMNELFRFGDLVVCLGACFILLFWLVILLEDLLDSLFPTMVAIDYRLAWWYSLPCSWVIIDLSEETLTWLGNYWLAWRIIDLSGKILTWLGLGISSKSLDYLNMINTLYFTIQFVISLIWWNTQHHIYILFAIK